MIPSLVKSLDMQRRAIRLVPGMTQLLSKRPDQFSLGVWPGYYQSAKGAEVVDLDGNVYLDMSIGGIGATILGYADPEVDAAVVAALSAGVATSLNCPEEVLLAERLCELTPWAEMVRFTRSGGEAMAMAARIARAAAGRDHVAFCGYHGWHDWYLAANLGGDSLGGHLLPGLSPAGVPAELAGTARPFRYNHPEELREIVRREGDRLAAIVMEPIRNAPPAPGFLEEVRELADRVGAVLIFDEISVGFRLHAGGAHLLLGAVRPDMAVFGKALGNGYPIAAVVGRREVMEAAQRTFISSTNWTERLGPAAALATLDRMRREPELFDRLARHGAAVKAIWSRAAGRHGLGARIEGIDPMAHFTFERDHAAAKALFVQCLLERGVLGSTVYYAMAAHEDADIERYAQATEAAFERIAQAMERGSLEAELVGRPAAAGFARLT